MTQRKRGQEYQLRNAFLLRDNNKCRWCGEVDNLHVHHLNHEKSTVDQIITLCRKCHNRIHLIENIFINGRVCVNLWCLSCREGDTGARFITKELSTKKLVYVCPDCGRGFTKNENGEILEEWINPFHSEMIEIFPPTTLEIGQYVEPSQ